jgi:hypothetical protein
VVTDVGAGVEKADMRFRVVSNGVTTERLQINHLGAIGLSGANYGTAGQVLTSGGADAGASWSSLGTAAARNLAVGTTAPGSPAVGDLWVDTN